MSAKMIPVLPITDTRLTSSTLPEDDFDAWAVGTTYAATADDAPVKVIKGHVIYASLQGSNVGNDPEVVANQGVWWTKGLATNRWSVFDGYIQNQSSRAESATWVVTPGAITNSVSLFNLIGESVTIVVTDPTDGEVYNRTFPLVDNTAVVDAYTYFFSPIVTIDNLCVTDLPPYGAAAISVTVSNAGSTAAVGQIAFGYSEVLGITLNEVPLGINDFTRLNEDSFGRTTPVIRGYSRTATPAIAVDSFRVTYLEKKLADQRGIPTVWAFDTRHGDNQLVYLGFFSSYNFMYQYAEKTILDIDIRSLV
jgi:hypothetical protein